MGVRTRQLDKQVQRVDDLRRNAGLDGQRAVDVADDLAALEAGSEPSADPLVPEPEAPLQLLGD
jgi:hypothetical protein